MSGPREVWCPSLHVPLHCLEESLNAILHTLLYVRSFGHAAPSENGCSWVPPPENFGYAFGLRYLKHADPELQKIFTFKISTLLCMLRAAPQRCNVAHSARYLSKLRQNGDFEIEPQLSPLSHRAVFHTSLNVCRAYRDNGRGVSTKVSEDFYKRRGGELDTFCSPASCLLRPELFPHCYLTVEFYGVTHDFTQPLEPANLSPHPYDESVFETWVLPIGIVMAEEPIETRQVTPPDIGVVRQEVLRCRVSQCGSCSTDVNPLVPDLSVSSSSSLLNHSSAAKRSPSKAPSIITDSSDAQVQAMDAVGVFGSAAIPAVSDGASASCSDGLTIVPAILSRSSAYIDDFFTNSLVPSSSKRLSSAITGQSAILLLRHSSALPSACL